MRRLQQGRSLKALRQPRPVTATRRRPLCARRSSTTSDPPQRPSWTRPAMPRSGEERGGEGRTFVGRECEAECEAEFVGRPAVRRSERSSSSGARRSSATVYSNVVKLLTRANFKDDPFSTAPSCPCREKLPRRRRGRWGHLSAKEASTDIKDYHVAAPTTPRPRSTSSTRRRTTTRRAGGSKKKPGGGSGKTRPPRGRGRGLSRARGAASPSAAR